MISFISSGISIFFPLGQIEQYRPATAPVQRPSILNCNQNVSTGGHMLKLEASIGVALIDARISLAGRGVSRHKHQQNPRDRLSIQLCKPAYGCNLIPQFAHSRSPARCRFSKDGRRQWRQLH